MASPVAVNQAPGRTTRLVLSPDSTPVVGTGLARRHHRVSSLEQGTLGLEPRGVGEMLDASCEFLAARFGPCFGVSFLLWFPALFIDALLIRSGDDLVYLGWTLVAPPLVGIFTLVFVCSLVGGFLEGRFVPAGEALMKGLSRTPGMILLGSLTGLLTALGMCCVVPGLAFEWLFAVVPAVYVLENVGLSEALKRAVGLVTTGAGFLRWLGLMVVGGAMALPFTLAEQGLSVLPVRQGIEEALALGALSFDLTVAAIGASFMALGTSFLAVVKTFFYLDLRVRREGLDLELRLSRLEQGEGS